MRYSRKSTWPIGMEALERRTMMAADAMNNFLEPHDVNDDHMVAPLDALLIVNHLNDDQPHSDDRQLFRDVNDDHVVGPLDALLVVNVLNRRHGADDAGGGERGTLQEAWVSGLDGSRARVEFESEGPTRRVVDSLGRRRRERQLCRESRRHRLGRASYR